MRRLISSVGIAGALIGVFLWGAPMALALAPAAAPLPGWASLLRPFDSVWSRPHLWSGYVASPSSTYTAPYASAMSVFSVTDSNAIQVNYQGGSGSTYPNWGSFHFLTDPVTVGTPLTVSAGTPIKLEWACQDWYGYTYGGSCNSFDVLGNCNGYGGPVSSSFPQYTSSLGTNFNTGGALHGSVTVTPAQTTTYTLTCYGAFVPNNIYSGWRPNYISPLTVTVIPAITAAPPTVNITSDALLIQGVPTAIVGQPTHITATFAASAGDTLTKTAINDFQGNLLPGLSQTPLSATNDTKAYTFTPSQPGSYLFTPSVWTFQYQLWNNYGKSLTLMAVAGCANGTGPAGACTNCNQGFHSDGNGSCVINVCPGGQNNPPTCSTCGVGSHDNGSGVCIPNTCADPHAVAPLCSTCVSPYTMQSGTCTLTPPTLSLSALATHVRKGDKASLSWNVLGLAAGVGTACSVTSNPAGIIASSMPQDTAPTWSRNNVATAPITSTTIFTLSCTNAVPTSVTVSLIPSFQEH